IRLQSSDALAIPFSLIWGGFAICWEAMVIVLGAPFFFALWGIPFVLIRLYMIVGRFFADALQRGKTVYGVTDRRVIISSGLFGPRVQSLPLNTLQQITLSERPDRSGTITFGSVFQAVQSTNSFSLRSSRDGATPAFVMIEDARTVYDLIQRAQMQRMTADDRWNAA